MKRLARVACFALLLTQAMAAQPAGRSVNPSGVADKPLRNVLRWSFDDLAVTALPSGAMVLTGEWEVRAEGDAPSPPNAFCQVGDAEYPYLILSHNIYTDLVMTSRFKIRKDHNMSNPTAGLIFRMRDKHHFYLVRVNTGEGYGNLKLYKYWAGQRNLVKYQAWPLERGRWYELGVEVRGNLVRAYLDGQFVMETQDNTYDTGGKVGLWVKHDSATCFDEVMVGELQSTEHRRP